MWILECDGDILSDKRIWLRPGKTYLFGRTKPENSRYQTGFRINHKTVSRKHLVITVASSSASDVGHLSQRTELTFEDAGTKLGTKIDSEKISSGGKIVSSSLQHTFTLSGYQHAFRITWKPVVISFTFSSKDTKGGKDPLQPIHARLAGLDIKAISNYAATKTTHVIASKRNTARGLQALIQGARIVTEEFVDAIVAGATPSDLDAPESFAPLEEDFDAAWPEDSAFLPLPGREPGPKEPELFEPDPERVDIFQGMVFVFCDTRQFDALQPPITDGGGKAVIFNLEPEKTTVSELKRYVKTAAGEHDDGQLEDGGKVVVVKFGAPKGYEEWSNQLQYGLSVALGYRLIEQNEFLCAILEKDVGQLSQRLGPDHTQEQMLPVFTSTPSDSSARQSEVPEPMVDSRSDTRRRPRVKVASAFQGFDSGFDASEVLRAPGHLKRDLSNLDDVTPSERDTSQEVSRVGRKSKKRPQSESSEDDVEVIEARMFPGAAIMKRRKLARGDTPGSVASGNGGAREDRESSQTLSVTAAPSEIKVEGNVTNKKGGKKESSISAAARARREAWDATRAREEEEDEVGMAGLEDMTASQMKSLAVIESMEVQAAGARGERKPLAEGNGNGHRENGRAWKEEWNGRKNFKKFRPQGQSGEGQRQTGSGNLNAGQTLIVPLEEIRKRESGVGEGYWDVGGNSTSKATSRYKQRIRSRWEDEAGDDDDDDRSGDEQSSSLAYRGRHGGGATQGSKTSRITDRDVEAAGTTEEAGGEAGGDSNQIIVVDDDEDDDDEGEEPSMRSTRTRSSNRSNGTGTGMGTGTQQTGSARHPPAKRGFPSQGSSTGDKTSGPTKRVKKGQQSGSIMGTGASSSRRDRRDEEEEEESSEDDLKFRFRPRRKA